MMNRIGNTQLTLDMVVASLADHTHDAVVITKAEPIRENGPEIVWVNRSFTEMTGYSAEEVIGKTPRILQGSDIDPEARARIYHGLQTWKPVQETLKNYRKDGTPFWVDLSIKPVADPSGWFVFWVAIQRDVTEQVAQSRALRLALEEANAAEQAQASFLSTMSHEIRTPLNGVLGTAQILPMLGELNDAQRAAVSAMQESGNILLKLIDDILDLARVRSGRSELKLVTIDPAELVAQAVVAVRAQAERKGLEILTGISEAVRPFLSDDRRLLQILVNLLGNAVKFTESGQIEVRVRRTSNDTLEFLVKDTGPGIAPEVASDIFQPFCQGVSGIARPYEGAGLGLAICQQFATALGGSIGLTSEVGRGSTFRLEVPATEPTAIKAGVAPSSRTGASLTGKILIVEDNELNRAIVEQAFRFKGWSVVAIDSGIGATDLIRQHRPDVVLLDRHLPGASGDEVLRNLRGSEEGIASTPVIMLTADARKEAERDTIALGASCFFSKPVDIMSLIGAAEGFLGHPSPPDEA